MCKKEKVNYYVKIDKKFAQTDRTALIWSLTHIVISAMQDNFFDELEGEEGEGASSKGLILE